MDWSACKDVERRDEVMSGAWVVKGTRVPVDAILANAHAGFSADDIAARIFPTVSRIQAQRVIDFAGKHEAHPA